MEDVSRVLGVSSWSLYQWAKRYGNDHGMVKRNRRPGDRSAPEKLKAVIEFEGLEGDKQGEYLRREGLHSDHIAAWKKSGTISPARIDPRAMGLERSLSR